MSRHLRALDGAEARSRNIAKMLEILGDVTERVRRGDVISLVVIEDLGTSYKLNRSAAENMYELVGKLELAKHAVMAGEV